MLSIFQRVRRKSMVPYITALLILIVASLMAVYNRVDGFTNSGITESTTIKDLISYLQFYVNESKAMKDFIDTNPEFDESLTVAKKTELGFDIPVQKPLSKALSLQLGKDITQASSLLDSSNKAIASGAWKETNTIKQTFTDATMRQRMLDELQKKYAIILVRKGYMIPLMDAQEKKKSAASTSKKTPTTTTGGIYDALCGTDKALKSSESTPHQPDVNVTKSKPKKVSEKEPAPSTSPVGSREMEDRIAKGVAKQLKDSILMERSTQDMNAMPCPYASYDSTATEQGKDYTTAKPHPGPDMNEYIRKDSIPCWNCSLP